MKFLQFIASTALSIGLLYGVNLAKAKDRPVPGTPEYASWVRLRPSRIPVPVAPPAPKQRKTFDVSTNDQAGAAARDIAKLVASFPNRRGKSPAAVWRESESVVFSIQDYDTCLERLAYMGVSFATIGHVFSTPVPAPGIVTKPIEGVSFVSDHEGGLVIISCELAARLYGLAVTLKPLGVTEVRIMSAYRDHPKTSFHGFGLALDIASFVVGGTKVLVVARDFEVTPNSRTCEASPKTESGKSLLAIACAIAKSNDFSTIITPNYNQGHHDHFHIDIRPDDPRIFLR